MSVEAYLRERAEAMTTMLSEPQWKPSRAHVETLRNYMSEGAAEIERLRAALVSIGILNAHAPYFNSEIDRVIRECAVEQQERER